MDTALALVQGSYLGLSISLGCAAAVVFFATRLSVMTSLAATLSMGAVAACVVACMYVHVYSISCLNVTFPIFGKRLPAHGC